MSKKLKKLLEKLNVENVDEVITAINAEDDSEEIIETLLTKAQSYSKPFLKAEFKAEFDTERKALKGKYFQDAARKANKEFGNVLTNKEIEDIISDPENEGSTYDAVIKAVKEKVSSKTGQSDSELQKMLDAANGKTSELEAKMSEMAAKFEKDLANGISAVKLKGVLAKKLIEILPKYTNLNPVKAAELIAGKISEKAHLSLKGEDDISLHDVLNNELPLKKNETTLQTFEGLVSDTVKEFDLPVAKSAEGTKRNENNNNNDNNDTKAPPALKTAKGLEAAFAATAVAS